MQNYNINTNIPQDIFRAYDIRGIVDETFTPDNIYTIGMAIGSEARARGQNTLIIGRDGRLSGPELLQALSHGLRASGCNVINIGEVTTPILYYATHILGAPSGLMLTGSHNPPNYNGVKIVLDGEALYGEKILALHARIAKRDFAGGMVGGETLKDIIDGYLQRITDDIKIARKMKIVVDCGNGVGGKIAPKLFRALGCEVIELFCEVDGNFPHHHPDPSVPKNLADIIAAVEKHQADVGFAFDGDADRVGVITNRGKIITADRLLMIYVADVLSRNPGAIIPYDVKCTRHLAAIIAKVGGKPLMVQTGHSLVKAKMKEVNAPLAGEYSGHIFFKDRWYGFDDGIYAAARCVELLSRDARSSDAVFAAFPESISTPELKIAMADDKKFAFMDKLVKQTTFADAKVTTIDGLRADFKDGFGLVRSSNTTPYIIMRFEADNEDALVRIQKAFNEKLLALDPSLILP